VGTESSTVSIENLSKKKEKKSVSF